MMAAVHRKLCDWQWSGTADVTCLCDFVPAFLRVCWQKFLACEKLSEYMHTQVEAD